MNQQERTGRTPNRILVAIVAVALLICVAMLGWLVIDTILLVRDAASPVANFPDTIATQMQEVINPTPTIIADPGTVVRSVQNLSRLETASYTIEKVITAESGEGPFGFLFRDRLLLVAQGEVIAGVDLSRISEEDIRIEGSTVIVKVPASEIFVATLDNDNTYVYDRQTGLLGQQIDLETLARREAEDAILQAALEDGILDLAQHNAEIYVSGLLEALGFEDVILIAADPEPDQNRGN